MTLSQYVQFGFAMLVLATSMQVAPGLVFAVANATVTTRGNVELLYWMLK